MMTVVVMVSMLMVAPSGGDGDNGTENGIDGGSDGDSNIGDDGDGGGGSDVSGGGDDGISGVVVAMIGFAFSVVPFPAVHVLSL